MFAFTSTIAYLLLLLSPTLAAPTSSPITCSSTPIAVEEAHYNGLYYIIKNQERNFTLAVGECKAFVNKSARSKACGVEAPGKISSQEWCERYEAVGERCFEGGKKKWGFGGSSAGVRVTVEKNPAY